MAAPRPPMLDNTQCPSGALDNRPDSPELFELDSEETERKRELSWRVPQRSARPLLNVFGYSSVSARGRDTTAVQDRPSSRLFGWESRAESVRSVDSRHELQSVGTISTCCTAAEYLSITSNGYRYPSNRPVLTADNLHTARARDAGLLWPGEQEELDWSGFGRHVQYPVGAELPFKNMEIVATTSRATVDAVECRRVRLARKTMLCHRRFTPEEALEEVRHLQALNHCHIVRLVGSYAQGKHFSILTYPVAKCDLRTFLAETEESDYPLHRRHALTQGFSCLSAAIEYVHAAGMKHMDIKPQNILVDPSCHEALPDSFLGHFRFYITDFGISRFVQDLEASETDGFSQRTLMYCSPEVAAGLPRGRSSDIFSLGCVFAEMLTNIACKSQAEFRCYRADDGETFHKNLPQVIEWIDGRFAFEFEVYSTVATGLVKEPTKLGSLGQARAGKTVIKRMLQEEPKDRPTAMDLVESFSPSPCCRMGPVPFVGVREVKRVRDGTNQGACSAIETRSGRALRDME